MMNGLSHQNLPFLTTKDENDDGSNAQVFLGDQHLRREEPHESAKWMSSKMRFMKKMMSSTNQGNVIKIKGRQRTQAQADPQQVNQESSSSTSSTNTAATINNHPTGIIRVCSDCNTTKTPLWRSGPQGPKSLCNACGIRQRKARRAMAAAAAASAELVPTETVSDANKAQKEKKSTDHDHMVRTLPFKKRCKITAAVAGTAAMGNSQKKHRLDDFTIRLSKSSAFHQQVFPQDERDAAILLMILSCGLIHSVDSFTPCLD